MYGRDVPVDNPDWHNRPFPFKGAKQLRRLLWHGTDIESLSQALPQCPHVTTMKFLISSYYEDWTIERLQTWPTYTSLRQLEMDTVVIGNEIGWSCLLLPFARFSRKVAILFCSCLQSSLCSRWERLQFPSSIRKLLEGSVYNNVPQSALREGYHRLVPYL